MAEAGKKGSSSAGLKEKNLLLDMDIGTDFFSWKSMSMAEGDGLDFDLTPVSKGNKKSFGFSKADMDFNLDGDFGKISSFNIDMPDIDISPPLKKDGKSKEKSNESSSGKDKGEMDHFDFGFDFDKIGNFSFETSLTKKDSRSQREKNNKESSPDENTYQGKEGSVHMNLSGNMNNLEDGPQKPSLSENGFNLDLDCLVGSGKDVEKPKKSFPLKMAIDDTITSVNSAARDELASDGRNDPPRTTITSEELPKTNQSGKLISMELVDVDTCAGNDAELDLSSDSLANDGINISSEAQEEPDCIATKVTGPDIERDVLLPSVVGASCDNKHTMPENLQHLQPVAITEKNSCDKNEVVISESVMDFTERTECGRVNSCVEKQCAKNPLSGIPFKMPSARENLETASETLKLPLASQPNGQSDKEAMKRREPLVTCLKSFIQSGKLERPAQKAATQTTLSSSSEDMDSAEPSMLEGRESVGIQGAGKLVSPPIQLSSSKTLLKMDIPQMRNQENYKCLKTFRECSADGLEDGKQPPDPSTTHNKDTVKAKSSLKQREMSTRSLDTPSSTMEISTKSLLQNSRNLKSLSSVLSTKSTPAEEQKLSSIQTGKKPPELHVLKLPGLNLDSEKSYNLKDAKSGGNISQTRTSLRKTPSDIAHFPDSQKQVPSCLSVKRKTLEKDGVDGLHPSKRPSQSLPASRYLAKACDTVHVKEVPNHSRGGDSNIKIATENFQVSTLQIPHENTIRLEVMSCNTDTDNNIKLAKAYDKELDDLCNKLRKMHDEAKELLVQATVNSNKLLMLNNPVLDEQIHATQKLLARLTLDSAHG